MALATVNEDGTPHNTPLFFAIDPQLQNVYFASREDSLHSKNLARTGRGFAVLYNSHEFTGGLYLTIAEAGIVSDQDKDKALKVYEETCRSWNNNALPENFSTGNSDYKLYQGTIEKIEIYESEEGSDGKLKKERRKEVILKDLLSE